MYLASWQPYNNDNIYIKIRFKNNNFITCLWSMKFGYCQLPKLKSGCPGHPDTHKFRRLYIDDVKVYIYS